MRRVAVVVLLAALGVILYSLLGKERVKSTPSIEKTGESASAPQKKTKTTPRRIAPQNMQDAAGSDFEDDPPGTLRLDGQVVDEQGNGVKGALIGISSAPSRQTLSGENGWFSFENLVGRTYYLDAYKDNLYGSASTLLNDETTPLTIRMRKGSSVEVTVLDEVDRHPIENAEITWGWLAHMTATTNAEGKALIQGLEQWVSLYITADGYSPQQDNMQGSADTEHVTKKTILMAKGAMVSGVVLDPDGKPVPKARVDASQGQGWGLFWGDEHKILTDPEGRFQIPALEAGTYRFSARSEDFAEGYSEPITLDGKTPREDVLIRLEPAGVITGRVVTRNGEAVPGAIVRAMKDTEGWRAEFRRAYADEAGKFTIKGMPKAPLLVGASSTSGTLSTPVPLDLTNGDAEVTLTIDIEGVIAGIVVDTSGQPIAEAEVRAMPQNYGQDRKKWRLIRPSRALTDPDGKFELKGVVEGEPFVLYPEFTGMTSGNFRDKDKQVIAKAGDRDVKLVLMTFASVKGRVQLADGTVPKSYTVSAGYRNQGTFSNPDGSFEIKEVDPGKQVVRVDGADFRTKTTEGFEVKSGEVYDIGVITVEAGRSVKGVVLSDGKPVKDAVVMVSFYVGGGGSRLEGENDFNKNNRALSKEDGSFEILGLDTDEELVAIAEHPTLGRSAAVPIAKKTGNATVELSLQPGGALEGVVTIGGKPLDGGNVNATPSVRTNANFDVVVGVDGKYRFDTLTPGTYEISASGQWMGQNKSPASKSATITIEVGKTKKLNLDIPLGVSFAISPMRDGKIANHVSITMLAGSFSPKDSEELGELTKTLPADQVRWGSTFAMVPGSDLSPYIFLNVVPGSYTLCLRQNPTEEEWLAMTDAQRDAPRPVSCQPQTITPEPKEQSATIQMPPK